MIVRKVTQSDDFDAIGNIYAQSWKSAYRGIVPQSYLDSLSGEQWADKFRTRKHDSFIILEGGKYIGTSSICAARDEIMAGYGEIISIYLLPEYFGQGYAEPLLNCAVNALWEKGYENIYLWTLEKNIRAQRFYEKNGFYKNGDTSAIEIAGKELTEIRYVRSRYESCVR